MKPLKIAACLFILTALTLTGFRCTRGVSPEAAQANRPVTLIWWRTLDDETAVRPIIEAYKTRHPNVTIEYRKLRLADYEPELLNALAEDRGPDIMSIHNTWIDGYVSKLTPLPAELTLPFQTIQGTLKKEVVVELQTSPTLSARDLKNNFVDAVTKDVLLKTTPAQGAPVEQIYGLPLSLDTLVLYANRDLLNLAGIPEAPKTWSELQQAVKKLTKLDERGRLIQSGAALGTSRNVENASDILALLMMQNGAVMLDDSGTGAFHKNPTQSSRNTPAPGAQALAFYTDFANPQKESYTWSAEEPNSLTAFVAGRTALFLGYAYHLPLIRARVPRLNHTIAPAPQIDGMPEVNFANYWVEAVSRKSPNQQWAWDFVQFATTQNNVGAYLTATGKPTALRALLNAQRATEDLAAFAGEALTAKSWYHGKNSRAASAAMLDAIDATLNGASPQETLNLTAQRINQTLK